MAIEDVARRPDRVALDETRAQHRECMQAVAAVEACLDRPPDRDGRWVAALRGALAPLREALASHFEDEQKEYLYRELPVAFPRFAQALDRLSAEHAAILSALDDAIRGAEEVPGARLHECRELNARVQLLVATIRRHEAEENEIIFSAYWEEVGQGD
jgi:hypothetical protein